MRHSQISEKLRVIVQPQVKRIPKLQALLNTKEDQLMKKRLFRESREKLLASIAELEQVVGSTEVNKAKGFRVHATESYVVRDKAQTQTKTAIFK